MNGGEIKNVLTLDVSKFDASVKKATAQLDKLDARLEKVGQVANKLDKGVSALSEGMGAATGGFQILNSVVGDVSKRLTKTNQGIDRVGKSSKKAASELSKLAGSAEKMESMADWTNHYGKALDKLNPLIGKTVKSHQELDKEFTSRAKNAKKSQLDVVRARTATLVAERSANKEAIEDRRKMVAELAKIEDRARVSAQFHTSEANKYFGKNISNPKRAESLELASAARAEAAAAAEQRRNLQAIVKEINWKNSQLRQGVIESMKEVAALRDAAALDAERVRQQKALTQAAKQYREEKKREQVEGAQTKRLMGEKLGVLSSNAADMAKRQKFYEGLWGENGTVNKAAKARADEEIRQAQRAEKERIRAARAAARVEAQTARETAELWKSLGAMYAGVQAARGVRAGTNSISEFELANKRIDFFNLPGAENARFKDKAAGLVDQNPLLTRKDSLLLRGDAMSALGHNDEAIIDKMMPVASKAATLLNTMGYDTNEVSTIMKNMWGTIELLGQQYDPREAKSTIEALFKAAVVSQGKVTIQDIETFLRNAGASGRGMTTEGLTNIIPLLEMFKTAGGGSGGGSGVARVGTMVKMMSAYANGKSMKNEGVEKLLGAGVMNAEFEKMTVDQFLSIEKKNIEMMRQLKTAGLKDADMLVEDPVKFVQNLRKPLLEYMMRDENFSQYFAGRDRFSYNDKGQMLNRDGQTVDLKTQDRVEIGAFSKFFNGMGFSQNTIDGMVTNMMASGIIRNEKVREQMALSMDVEKAFGEMMDTWAANSGKLKVAAINLAVAFEPVLDIAGKFISGFADMTAEMAKVMTGENSLSKFATVFGIAAVSAGAFARPLTAIIGLFGKLGGKAGSKGVQEVGEAMLDTGKKADGLGSKVGAIFGAGTLASAAAYFTTIKGGPALLGALRVGLTLLGGPFGILAGLLVTGASLWAAYGKSAETAIDKAKDSFKAVTQLRADVKVDEAAAAGKESMLEAEYKTQLAAYVEARKRDDLVEPNNPKFMSQQSKQLLNRLNEIDSLMATAKKQTKLAESSKAGVGKSDETPTVKTPRDGASREKKGGAAGELNEKNAYQISLEQLLGDAEIARIESIGLKSGMGADMNAKAEAAFIKAWMSGTFDDNKRKPQDRPMALGKFNKETGWTRDQIDLNSPDAVRWMNAYKGKESEVGNREGLEFSMGRAESAAEGASQALAKLRDSANGNTDSFNELLRSFARFEGKNPELRENSDYQDAKRSTLTNKAIEEYALEADAIKNRLRETTIELSNMGEMDKQVAKARLVFDTEMARLDATENMLRVQIKAYEDAGQTSDKHYLSAKSTLESMTPIYEQQREILKKSLQEASKTPGSRTMTDWMDLEKQFNQLSNGWLNNIGETLAGVAVGEDKIDLRNFAYMVTKDLSGMFIKSAVGSLGQSIMGDGTQGLFKMAGDLVKGNPLGGGGWLASVMNGITGNTNSGQPGLTSGMGDALNAAPVTGIIENIGLGKMFSDLAGRMQSFGSSLFGAESGLGEVLSTATSGLGDFVSGLFDGNSALGQFAGTILDQAMSAISSLFSGGGGGGAGGAMSGIGSMASSAMSWIGGFFANGGAFGATGLQAFAKGGAFTNGIYNSPTLFKFANGGSFNNGVMGEAGPEAVMPLSRDGSGRLGVALQGGGMGGGDTNVAIHINVQSDGSGGSSTSTGSEAAQWKTMANRVKGLVIQEIVNQKRPGGALA